MPGDLWPILLAVEAMRAGEGTIRPACPEDAAAILEIYAPYVRETNISFEYEVPTLEEFTQRVRDISSLHPYLVWEENGKLLGYAYAHPYAPRPAYQWGAELTIYLRQGVTHRGMGSTLYGALFDLLRLQGVRTVYGCITAENHPSVAMHRALGFAEGGLFRNAGYKFGRWLDVLWLEKSLGAYTDPEPFVPFPKVEVSQVEEVLQRWNQAVSCERT